MISGSFPYLGTIIPPALPRVNNNLSFYDKKLSQIHEASGDISCRQAASTKLVTIRQYLLKTGRTHGEYNLNRTRRFEKWT